MPIQFDHFGLYFSRLLEASQSAEGVGVALGRGGQAFEVLPLLLAFSFAQSAQDGALHPYEFLGERGEDRSLGREGLGQLGQALEVVEGPFDTVFQSFDEVRRLLGLHGHGQGDRADSADLPGHLRVQ